MGWEWWAKVTKIYQVHQDLNKRRVIQPIAFCLFKSLESCQNKHASVTKSAKYIFSYKSLQEWPQSSLHSLAPAVEATGGLSRAQSRRLNP